MQDFEQIEFLFDMNPKLRKNKKVIQIVDDFRKYYNK
jgi:mevalonate pyrophosphate decarboxylase